MAPKAFFDLAWVEPFRLLFPLGILLGITGVLLWPLYYSGWIPVPYPVPHHGHIMVQGFLGSFVFGFLGTAMPRMLSSPPLKAVEVGVIVGLQSLSTLLHLSNHVRWGNTCFLLLLLLFAASMLLRFSVRQDVPPPGFVLILFGWSSAVLGTALLVAIHVTTFTAFWYRLAHLLLYQGFLLFPVLGIGAFFFPRFFALPNRHDFEVSKSLPDGWLPRALLATVCGSVILTGFVVEAKGMLQTGPALRLLAAGLFLGVEVPFFKRILNHGTLGACVATALLILMTGMLCQALFSGYAIAMEHIVFMGGFGLLALTVGTRVVLGHSGQSNRFKDKLRPMSVLFFLVMAALLTRLSADLFPSTRISHHIYAAILWVAAVLVWAVKILPGVLFEDDEE